MNGEAHAVQNTLELQNRKRLAKILIVRASEILQHLQQSLPVLNVLHSDFQIFKYYCNVCHNWLRCVLVSRWIIFSTIDTSIFSS